MRITEEFLQRINIGDEIEGLWTFMMHDKNPRNVSGVVLENHGDYVVILNREDQSRRTLVSECYSFTDEIFSINGELV